MDLSPLLERVRSEKPLVHHITNWVTIYDCAQIVKSFGASPVMAHALEEAAEMTTRFASALVLNIGTLTRELIDAMILAGKAANAKGVPVVLDVCGAGATGFRNSESQRIIHEIKVDIIKGNTSEIASVAGEAILTRGVDATEVGKDLSQIALSLAAARGCTVVVTGKRDLVADASGRCLTVDNGHEIMQRVVGTGCMAASVIGTFAAVEKDLAAAAAAGLACYEIAAEQAAAETQAPGSWKVRLFDKIATLTAADVKAAARVGA